MVPTREQFFTTPASPCRTGGREKKRIPQGLLSPIVLGVMLLMSSLPDLLAEVILPGVVNSQLDPALKGLVLIEELNCAACHTGALALATRSKQAPRLAAVGSRINPHYIEAFIENPHGIKPGTTMPDTMSLLGAKEKSEAATSIAHFLLSLKQNDFSLQAPDPVAAQHGQRLFHARGCAACHSPRDDKATELLAATSVPLGALEKKYSFNSLVAFLGHPHVSRPSGRMPDLSLANQDLERIAHYLLQDTRVPGPLAYTLYSGKIREGLASDKVTAERAGQVKDFALESLGKLPHHSGIKYEGWINIAHQGPYKFHLTMNGGSLAIDELPLVKQDPSDQRGVKQLEGATDLAPGWHRIQVVYYHTGQKPSFALEMEGPQFVRQTIPSAMLSIFNPPVPDFEPLKVNAELAARGREQFSKLGCANCHNDLQVPLKPAPSFAQLNASRGCLSEATGSWPHFDLSAQQRALIREALPHAEEPQLNNSQQIAKTLATFNCIACHERAGLGGIAPERNALFTGPQGALGDQGRLPPPLTQVGAKLKPEWIKEVLLHRKRQREYLDTSMPQFGEANVGHLVELFGKVDQLESVSLPKIANIEESKNAGYEMVGASGLSCIACHEFNGQKSGDVGALDIAHVTERLKRNWFELYMRQPSRFHPTVIMPSYWPNGQSTRPNVLGGDTAQQIQALWAYLEDGVRAKKPAGLSRQSNELRVGDMTEICRGRGPAGYRGIAVGYLERINLAFDSEEMALRQLWKGEFATVDPGLFRPRGTDPISFPPGIPFHRLKSLEDSWPYKAKTNYSFPQDQGYQFRGYHLDAKHRPTFIYQYGDISVEDFFEDAHDPSGRAFFKRTFTFQTTGEPLPFYFRAATGTKVTAQSGSNFAIDQLQLRITSGQKAVVRKGDPGEVLIPLTLPKGRSTLTLEYQW